LEGKSGSQLAPVSLVIPIRNEAATLSALLSAIARQSVRPSEIIVVDTGSADASMALIDAWWKREEGWAAGACRVVCERDAYPGAARNVGIRSATQEWIAFLDGGLVPQADWLACLCACAKDPDCNGVFGLCSFTGDTTTERALCALSYGVGSMHPVIPASMFRRSTFEAVGMFRTELRSAEDLVWTNAFVERYGAPRLCPAARVAYSHFPRTLSAAMQKWFVYEVNTVRAGLMRRRHLAFAVVIPTLVGLFLFQPYTGWVLVGAYIAGRGLVDPARRSRLRPWWSGRPLAPLFALVAAPLLDMAKVAGAAAGWWEKLAGKRT
jgi:hypothetical protein